MNTLEVSGGTKVDNPTAEDVDRALALPRDDDWYLNLARGDDDYIDATIEDGALWVECEEAGKFEQAKSHVDDAMLRAILLDFAAGGSEWRGMALWAEPARKAAAKSGLPSIPVIAGVSFGVLLLLTLFIGKPWLVMATFALAFPGMIAVAAITKMQEVIRAASWTKASGRVTRSELEPRTINGKEVLVPKVEYEFTVGTNVNKVRGDRVSIGENAGPYGAQEILARYRVGANPAVYYNPADPRESVLERDMPKYFHAVWAAVAIITAGIAGTAYWFGFR